LEKDKYVIEQKLTEYDKVFKYLRKAYTFESIDKLIHTTIRPDMLSNYLQEVTSSKSDKSKQLD